MITLGLWVGLVFGEIAFKQSNHALEVSIVQPSWNYDKKSLSSFPYSFDIKQNALGNVYRVPGEPMLSKQSFLVLARPEELVVDLKWGESLQRPNLFPAPYPKYPCRCDKNSSPVIKINWDKYQSYPQSKYQLDYVGRFQGQDITLVTLPTETFSLASGLKEIKDVSARISKKDFETLHLFSPLSVNWENSGVAIVPQSLRDLGELYVEKKRQEGMDFRMLEVDVSKTPKDIQKMIQNVYQEKSFSFAIIFGDESVFPPFYLPTSGHEKTPSDMPYFTFDGEGDVIPDVIYARFPFNRMDDFQDYLTKVSSVRISNKLGIASNEGQSPSDLEYIQEGQRLMQRADHENKIHFQNDRNSGADKIAEDINLGVQWIHYIGHGSGFAWPSVHGGQFDNSHIDQLENSDFPIVLDVACQNGRFNGPRRFGQNFLTGLNGAMAYYGGSVDISWDPPAIMSLGVSKAIGEKGRGHLGEFLFAGQLYLLSKYGNTSEAKENLVWYHLLGDPTIEVSVE